MSVILTARMVGDVAVLDVSGRIMLRNGGAASLRDNIRDLAKQGKKKVIINMAETIQIDSSGVGELVSGFTALANQGAELKLLALNERVKTVLQITRLYTVFEVYDEEAKAVESFKRKV